MDSIFIRSKDELFSQVHEQIEKAKIIVSQTKRTVEQAKRQSDRMKKGTGTYFPSPKVSTKKINQ